MKKNPGLQDLTFFCGLKQTFLSQHLDFQKLRCILKGQVELVERIKLSTYLIHHVTILWILR